MTRLPFHLAFVKNQVQGSLNLIKDHRYYNNDNYPQLNHLIQNDTKVILESGTSQIFSVHKETFSLI